MLNYTIALGVALAIAVPEQVTMSVPSSLLLRAQRSPMEIALLLANASIPAGIEIKESDSAYPRPVPDLNLTDNSKVPAGEFVRRFNEQHADYRMLLRDGVLVIRPLTGAVRFLDSPSSIEPPAAVSGAMASMRRIFSSLDPRLIGGVVLNSLGEAGENMPVVLDGSAGRQVVDTLNQVALQTWSTWQVISRVGPGSNARIIAFGLIHKNGRSDMQPMSR